MDFTSQDIALIEQALQLAVKSQNDPRKAASFQEVLSKLQTNAAAALRSDDSRLTASAADGFRYDYDDSSDLS